MGRGFPQGTAEGASEGTATDLGSGLGEEGRVGSRCTLPVGNCWEGGLLIEAEVRELRVLTENRISRLLSLGTPGSLVHALSSQCGDSSFRALRRAAAEAPVKRAASDAHPV